MLAFYSWDTDEQQLVSEAELPALLAELARGQRRRPTPTRRPGCG